MVSFQTFLPKTNGTAVTPVESVHQPVNVVDDRCVVSFAEVAKRDQKLADRLIAVAQRLVQSEATNSLGVLNDVTLRVLAAAAPEDVRRVHEIVTDVKRAAEKRVKWDANRAVVVRKAKTVGSCVLDGALFPFLSNAVVIGSAAAVGMATSPWLLIPGAAVALIHGVSSYKYYTTVHGWNISL